MGLGYVPSDGEMSQKAKEVMGTEKTAADDAVLVGKFRDMMAARLQQSNQTQYHQGLDLGMMDMSSTNTAELTSGELDDLLLQDMDFDFTDLGGGGGFDGNLVGFEGIDLLMPQRSSGGQQQQMF